MKTLVKRTRLCSSSVAKEYSDGTVETLYYPPSRRVAHTCADENNAPCLVAPCSRPVEWHETEYGKHYMDVQRHEGLV